MIQTYADATTDDTRSYYYYLKFVNCKNNPDTIKLAMQSDIIQQSIFIPTLPKPKDFPQFKGWKIVNTNANSDYQILSDKDIIYTKRQELIIGCMIGSYSFRYDITFTAIPIIDSGVSFNIAWGEF